MGDSMSERLWTVAEAANYLNVPTSAIYKMTARAARLPVPHVRLAGRLRFRRSDLDRWIGLLSTSNLTTLEKMRASARRAADGHDP